MNAVRLILLVGCTLIAACGPPVGASSLPSSSPVVSPAGGAPIVTGTGSAGPVCTVERLPPDPRCAPRPVAGAVVVATNASGEEVRRVTSGADGSYELVVSETGTVLVTAQPVVGLIGRPAPTRITLITRSEVVRLELEYDTGIR